MKNPLRIVSLTLFSAVAVISFASDHNNIDAGRPLRFDDAYSIAFRERSLEFGLGFSAFRDRSTQYGLRSEYKYGFAPNRDFSVSFDPTVGGGIDSQSNNFNPNNVELSYFQGVQREIRDSPALGFRVDAGLPTGNDAKGVDVRLRGILTKTVNQYDRVHINLDVNLASRPQEGERTTTVDAILGYSKPLGYPTRFDQTLVAQFALTQGRGNGQGYTGTLGLGLRKQVGVRSVFDIGIESDVFAPSGAIRSPLRIVAGYSVGF